ncbi:MAG: nuclear transport factor 2 family protein [Prevotellaceae bacterium]|nr:nuclear transport factor 2 family protein [Prevotellaceae bacterium]
MIHKIFKICLLCTVFASFAGNLSAQYATSLTVTDIEPSVAQKMEANATALLTELNSAFFSGKTPALKKITGLSKDGKSSILNMWETTAPFRCIETEIIERGYKTPSGYQVRNIPFILKDMPEDEVYKEIVINFNKSGAIDDIYFALDMHNYRAIMESEDNDVTDLHRRELILNFVENFRTAYNRKDIDLLAQVYSDDALIITGRVIKQTKSVENVLGSYGFSKEKIEYQVQTKKEYINKLRGIFKNNAKINVLFDNIEVVRHPKYDDIYGVRLKQSWNTTNYSDVGFLFLMIDFKDGENMQIHVRTWQPEKLDGKQLREDEIFQLGDFIIYDKK